MIFDVLFINRGHTWARGLISRCTSLGKNGVSAVAGVSIVSGGFKSLVRIYPINTRGAISRAWLDLPDEPATLRRIATALERIATAIDKQHRDAADEPDAGLIGAIKHHLTVDEYMKREFSIDEVSVGPPKYAASPWGGKLK